MYRALSLSLVLAFLFGCEGLNRLGEAPPVAPTAALKEVTLVNSPPLMELAAWTCYDDPPEDRLGIPGSGVALCELLASEQPLEADLKFSFDTSFDLGNANGFPVPLVELYLSFNVFKGAAESQLGGLCVSFCDPEAEECDPGASAEEACLSDDETVKDISDFDLPTVDDLVGLANDIATGAAQDEINNFHFRTIPAQAADNCRPVADSCEEVDGQMCCGEDCVALRTGCRVGDEDGQTCMICDGNLEAHIHFDLGVRAMLNILTELVRQGVESLLEGDPFELAIPYSVEGTLFFDVPILGRFSLNFGPFESTWEL